MRKADVETHYEHGRSHPAVNVKHHLWFPDLFRAYERTGTHEFSDDAGFWAWMHEIYDDGSPDDRVEMADEWARESCWDDATELAHEIWPQYSTDNAAEKVNGKFTGKTVPKKRYHVQVYSEGRQGGWCVVHGLPDIEEWDAIALGRWARFAKGVTAIAQEDYPYAFVWNLAVNVFEPIREERRNAYPAPAYT